MDFSLEMNSPTRETMRYDITWNLSITRLLEVTTTKSILLPQQKALLPRWNKFDEKFEPGSRDPLGFQRYATLFADQLLPNLTVLTTRARYYAFLAWTLHEITSDAESRLLVHDAIPFEEYDNKIVRFERFLALAEAIRHDEDGEHCSWIGKRRSTSLVRQRRRHIPLDVPLTVQEGSNGALADYRQSMQKLGLLAQESRFLPDSLTDEGVRLATLFRKAVGKSKSDRISASCLDLELSSIASKTLHSDGHLLCLSEISDLERAFLRPLLLRNEHEPAVAELKLFLKRRQVSEYQILLDYLKSKSQSGVAFSLRQAALYQILALACLSIFTGMRIHFKQVGQEQKVNDLIIRQLKSEAIESQATVSSMTKHIDWETEINALANHQFDESPRWISPVIRLLMGLAQEVQAEPQLIFAEAVESVSLRETTDLLLQKDWRVQDLLAVLIERLVKMHRQVFRSKAKQPWMSLEGSRLFLLEDAQEPFPQFPPNRLRLESLISVSHDLEGRRG